MSHPSFDARIMKQQIRKQIRSKLLALTPEEIRNQSNQVWMKFFDLLEYKNAKSIGLFLSMPRGEILTSAACRRVLQDNKRLYVPRVGLQFEHGEMDLIRVEEEFCPEDVSRHFYDTWPRNSWNIPEPPITSCDVAQKGDIDLLVVPGLCFDQFGGRLGQGKGYYDRFINRIKPPLLVGVALEPSWISIDGIEIAMHNDSIQRINEIPMMQHDIYMNMIITPSTFLSLRN